MYRIESWKHYILAISKIICELRICACYRFAIQNTKKHTYIKTEKQKIYNNYNYNALVNIFIKHYKLHMNPCKINFGSGDKLRKCAKKIFLKTFARPIKDFS